MKDTGIVQRRKKRSGKPRELYAMTWTGWQRFERGDKDVPWHRLDDNSCALCCGVVMSAPFETRDEKPICKRCDVIWEVAQR